MSRRILVPIPDPDVADKALTYALDCYPRSELTVLLVSEALRGDAHVPTCFASAREAAATYDTTITIDVCDGTPAAGILTRAEQFDLIVIGGHGGTWRDRLAKGALAETIARRAPVPVVVVR